MHVAAAHGHAHCAKVLHAHGADINSRAKKDGTPLCVAAKLGKDAAVDMLIELGAQLDVPDKVRRTRGHLRAVVVQNNVSSHVSRCCPRPDRMAPRLSMRRPRRVNPIASRRSSQLGLMLTLRTRCVQSRRSRALPLGVRAKTRFTMIPCALLQICARA